jgi:hypothetical protein
MLTSDQGRRHGRNALGLGSPFDAVYRAPPVCGRRARKEWDERYADLVLGKRNWQIPAAGSIAVSPILGAGIV